MRGETWEHRPHNFLALLPHRVSAYAVFFLWDAQFWYWLQKGWQHTIGADSQGSNYTRQH